MQYRFALKYYPSESELEDQYLYKQNLFCDTNIPLEREFNHNICDPVSRLSFEAFLINKSHVRFKEKILNYYSLRTNGLWALQRSDCFCQ